MKFKIYKLLQSISDSELITKGATAFTFKIGGMISIYLFHFLLASYAGAEANGIFSTFFTILSIFSVFCILGLDTFILKNIADSNSKNRFRNLKVIYLKALGIVLFLSTLFALILYRILVYGEFDFYGYSDIIYYVILCIIPFSILHVNAESFRAIKNIKLFSFFKNFSIFGFATAILVFGPTTNINSGVSAFTIAVFCLSIISLILWFKSIFKKVSFENTNISYFGMLKESFPMFLSGSLFLLMSWVDILMLGFFNSQVDVGIYTIAIKIAGLVTIFLFAINTILGPKISELYHNQKLGALAKLVQKTAILSFLFSLPILFIILLFPDNLLQLFGNDFQTIDSKKTLIILAFGQITNVFFGSVIYILDMTGRHIISRNILLFTAIVNIMLNFILIPKYSICGAAISTSISVFIWGFLGAFYVKKYFNFYAFPILNNRR